MRQAGISVREVRVPRYPGTEVSLRTELGVAPPVARPAPIRQAVSAGFGVQLPNFRYGSLPEFLLAVAASGTVTGRRGDSFRPCVVGGLTTPLGK